MTSAADGGFVGQGGGHGRGQVRGGQQPQQPEQPGGALLGGTIVGQGGVADLEAGPDGQVTDLELVQPPAAVGQPRRQGGQRPAWPCGQAGTGDPQGQRQVPGQFGDPGRRAFRTRPVVYPEIQRELCPGLFSETVPPGADADIFAWRQLAWDNAQRLLAAPTEKARDRIAKDIRQHARDKAREILYWYD